MARSSRRIWAVDCETEKAQYGRLLKPFLWGAYDGKTFLLFHSTEEFVEWAQKQNAILYAHNGGKFDFMFLITFIGQSRAQVINGRIVKIKLGKAELRDSISIIPESLDKFGKTKINYDWFEEKVRDKYLDKYIIPYLKQDCVVLYDLVTEYRRVAGKQITIASNALKFSKKLGIDPGKTNHTFDKNMRPFFFGGRCQVWQGGTHHNLRCLDIHSAYPYAMTHDHANGAEREHISPSIFAKLTREQRQRCFVRLRCNSNGAFPLRTKTELDFPVGYNEYYVSGWEFVAAEELELIRDVEFLDIIRFDGKINFKPYVDHWYEYKRTHDKETQPIQYIIGKIMMNSLYGKLAQNPARYFDYKIVPGGTWINECDEYSEHLNNRGICMNCGEEKDSHGWEVSTEFEGIEVHRRPALWKWTVRYGKAWEGMPLYNNVATGASITGFTRAHLLRAAHAIGIKNLIYSDTDSLICKATADLSKLSLTEKLGDWGDEGTASIGHFAGKKQYGLLMTKVCKKFDPKSLGEPCQKCGCQEHEHGNSPVVKIASKGSKLKFSDIEALMRGETVTWKSPFPHYSLAGDANFVVRNIRQTAKANSPVNP